MVYSAGEGQTAMDRLSEADAEPNSVFSRVFVPLLRADLPLLDAIKISQERRTPWPAPPITIRRRPITTKCWTRPASRAGCKEPSPRGVRCPGGVRRSCRGDDRRADEFRHSPLGMMAKLPDGPLKERAKARRAEVLKETEIANLTPDMQKPSPARSPTSGVTLHCASGQPRPTNVEGSIQRISGNPKCSRRATGPAIL